MKSHRIWLEPGAIQNNLEVVSKSHLGAVRKQLWSGHNSSTLELPSVTSGHYNQLLNPDDFSDSGGMSKLLMKKVLDTAQKGQRLRLSGHEEAWFLLQRWAWKEGGDDCTKPTGSTCPLPPLYGSFSSSSATCRFDFMLPMLYPVAWCLVYAGGNCVYIHI